MVRDLTADAAAMRRAAASGYSTATDLADWLMRELGLPFREAHRITGALVKRAEELGVPLAASAARGDADARAAHHRGVLEVLTVEKSVASRTSFGGTAPANVARRGEGGARALPCPASQEDRNA